MDSNQYSHQISSTKPIDQAAEERIKKVHAAHRLDQIAALRQQVNNPQPISAPPLPPQPAMNSQVQRSRSQSTTPNPQPGRLVMPPPNIGKLQTNPNIKNPYMMEAMAQSEDIPVLSNEEFPQLPVLRQNSQSVDGNLINAFPRQQILINPPAMLPVQNQASQPNYYTPPTMPAIQETGQSLSNSMNQNRSSLTQSQHPDMNINNELYKRQNLRASAIPNALIQYNDQLQPLPLLQKRASSDPQPALTGLPRVPQPMSSIPQQPTYLSSAPQQPSTQVPPYIPAAPQATSQVPPPISSIPQQPPYYTQAPNQPTAQVPPYILAAPQQAIQQPPYLSSTPQQPTTQVPPFIGAPAQQATPQVTQYTPAAPQPPILQEALSVPVAHQQSHPLKTASLYPTRSAATSNSPARIPGLPPPIDPQALAKLQQAGPPHMQPTPQSSMPPQRPQILATTNGTLSTSMSTASQPQPPKIPQMIPPSATNYSNERVNPQISHNFERSQNLQASQVQVQTPGYGQANAPQYSNDTPGQSLQDRTHQSHTQIENPPSSSGDIHELLYEESEITDESLTTNQSNSASYNWKCLQWTTYNGMYLQTCQVWGKSRTWECTICKLEIDANILSCFRCTTEHWNWQRCFTKNPSNQNYCELCNNSK